MRRREAIGFAGMALFASPLIARAQQQAKIARRYVYRLQEPQAVERIWRVVHPHDLVISPENTSLSEGINPDRIRYEVTPDGNVAHFLKSW